MNKIAILFGIIFVLSIFLSEYAIASECITVEVSKQDNNLRIESAKISECDLIKEQFKKPNEYIIELLSSENKIIDRFFFGFSERKFVDKVDNKGVISGGEIVEVNKSKVYLNISFLENASFVRVYDYSLDNDLRIPIEKDDSKIESTIITTTNREIIEHKRDDGIKKFLQKIILVVLIIVLIIFIVLIIRKRNEKLNNSY